MNNKRLFKLGLLSLLMGVSLTAQAANVLFYGPSLRAGDNEATIAAADGHVVTIDTAAAWSARGTASFASFDALVIGDQGCSTSTAALATAEATSATWGAAVGGNVVSYGYDPTFSDGSHGHPEAETLVENSINYAAGGGGTGLVMALGCYYVSAASGTVVLSLEGLGFGSFLVTGQGPAGTCDGVSFDDPGHPVLAGLTEAGIGNTGCSVHGVFDEPLPGLCESIARSTEADQPWIVVCEGLLEVAKAWRHTNVCFERDNDGDGSISEDGPDGVDNDGDGLFDEDASECPDGTNPGDVIDNDGDGTYFVDSVIKNNGSVASYNPGQLYAVASILILADVDELHIGEFYSDCTEGEHDLLDLNPKKGGGRAKVVVEHGDGTLEQVFDANTDDPNVVFASDESGTIVWWLDSLAAGDVVHLYVKFGPGKESSGDGACFNEVGAAASAGDAYTEVYDDAVLVVTPKDD